MFGVRVRTSVGVNYLRDSFSVLLRARLFLLNVSDSRNSKHIHISSIQHEVVVEFRYAFIRGPKQIRT